MTTPVPEMSDAVASPTVRKALHIVLLQVPDCPLVDRLRITVSDALRRVRIEATIEEVVGAFASPTLLIDGADVTGASSFKTPACRLDLPTEEDVLVALGVTYIQESA
jgi:hypothetical protein